MLHQAMPTLLYKSGRAACLHCGDCLPHRGNEVKPETSAVYIEEQDGWGGGGGGGGWVFLFPPKKNQPQKKSFFKSGDGKEKKIPNFNLAVPQEEVFFLFLILGSV